MKAVHLRTDDLINPLGLGDRTPSFSWHGEGGLTQSAYRIVCTRDGETIWNSGKTASSSMTNIPYEGKPLSSRDRIVWSVQLWDEEERPGEESEASFEMGLLGQSDWKAQWICGDYKPKKNCRYPADCFRKAVKLSGTVKRARLYASACGFYEAYLDRERVGDWVLAPGCTDYRKRLQAQTYDVTADFADKNEGESVFLTLLLGDGWYRGSIGCFGKTNVFGRETKVCAQLELFYEDGTAEVIGTDESFAWSNDGPIRFADFKDGETVDASLKPSYGGKAEKTACAVTPTPSDNVAVTRHEELSGKKITTPSGRTVYDFGQNLAGFLKFTVKGRKGQKLHWTLGEILDENGEFTQDNMTEHKPVKEFGRMTEIMLMTGNTGKVKGEMQLTPRQEVEFICSGETDHYETRFALFGFRYALLETDEDAELTEVRSVAVYSDMEQTGRFSCSNGKIDQLFANIVRSMRSNFIDIPMDCPTRERLGWTGDAQIFFRSSAYLYNVAPFYRKWLRDLRDDQKKDGKMSAVAPYSGFAMLYDNTGASAGWADAVTLIPQRFYETYGDKRVLEDCWEMCRLYGEFLMKNAGPADRKAYADIPHRKYVYEKGMHLGEWLEPEEFQDKIRAGSKIRQTEVATAYLHLSMKYLSEMAVVLGKTEDQKRFSEYAQGAEAAYQELFLREVPDTDRQAKLVRPLAFDLAEDEQKGKIAERLVEALEHYHHRVGTGFLSTPFLLPVLTENGYADEAYRVLENEEKPGWLYEVDHGATSIWENWEGTLSQNHYSPGAVCEWLFSAVGGIQLNGENRFLIYPVPGGSLTCADVEYDSPYGTVHVRWEREGEETAFFIHVPANTTAEIRLPDGTVREAGAGEYIFRIVSGRAA